MTPSLPAEAAYGGDATREKPALKMTTEVIHWHNG